MKSSPTTPLPAYKGEDPFVFVSYSHRDADIVYPEIRALQDRGIHVWYDEGIEIGEEWTNSLANAIRRSQNVLFFITPNSVASRHCRRELNFANHHFIDVAAVHLVRTALPDGLQLSLGDRQAILKYELAEDRFWEKLMVVLETPTSQKSDPSLELVSRGDSDDREGIVVLPFDARSSDQDARFIGEGLADEIITALSSLDSLRVISGSSSKHARTQSPQQLGQQLNVQYVLNGSVQRLANQLRLTARLTNCGTEEVSWAQKWDSSFDELFELQEAIALSVVKALNLRLSQQESANLVTRPIPDLRAYEFFLRARQLIQTYSVESLRLALDYLQQGEDIVGENEYILAARGHVHWQMFNLGMDSHQQFRRNLGSSIEKLIQLDGNSPDAHRLSGLLDMMTSGRVQSASNHFKMTLTANPNDTDALYWLAVIYGYVGRSASGMGLAEHLLRIDPLTPMNQSLPGLLSMFDGHFDKARTELYAYFQSNPDNPMAVLVYGQILAMCGKRDEAGRVLAALERTAPGTLIAAIGSFYRHAMAGDREPALARANDELKKSAEYKGQACWNLAQCYAQIDEPEQAIDWLEKAMEYGFWNYPLITKQDPLLEPVRQHERFVALAPDLQNKWRYFEL